MVALHRDTFHRDAPLSDCCVKTLIQYLAFDPALQDRVWCSTRSSRYNPAIRCSGYAKGGTCDLPILLDTLGFDPVAQTISWQRSKEPPGRDLQLGTLVTIFSHLSCVEEPHASTQRGHCTSLILRHHQKLLTHETIQDTPYSHKNLLLPGRARKVLGNTHIFRLVLTFEPRAGIHSLCQFPAEPPPCEPSAHGASIQFRVPSEAKLLLTPCKRPNR